MGDSLTAFRFEGDAPGAPRVAEGRAQANVFTVRGLSFSYDDAREPLFENFDLDVREGVVTTVIGANGSGKSTLLNLLSKNLKPHAGSIFLRGGNVADLRLRDYARLVAVVHQRNVAPGDLSVERLVGYGRFAHSGLGRATSAAAEDECMVAWALDVTGLADISARPVSELSGGQVQRAWIAMALAQGSNVLLLDEPTTYLDVRYQLEVLHLVSRLNRDFGMTVVMVLHDVNQALHYSDEVVALSGGHVVAQGSPSSVVTAELIRKVFDVDLEVVNVRGKPFVLAV